MTEQLLLVSVYLRPGQADALREYERSVKPIMERHGGRVEMVLVPGDKQSGMPDEIHLLGFDSEEGFARYREDPEMARFAALRDQAVQRAEILPVSRVPLETYFGKA